MLRLDECTDASTCGLNGTLAKVYGRRPLPPWTVMVSPET